MVLNVHRNHKAYLILGSGKRGEGSMKVGEEGGRRLYTCCYTVTTRMIPAGSDESHFNVSVGSDRQSQDSVHKPQLFLRERRTEAVSNRGPSAYQPNALLLGQTGSQTEEKSVTCFSCRDQLLRKKCSSGPNI